MFVEIIFNLIFIHGIHGQEEALWQSSLHLLHRFRSIDVDAWDSAIVASGRATKWEVCLALLTQRWRVDTPHTWRDGG